MSIITNIGNTQIKRNNNSASRTLRSGAQQRVVATKTEAEDDIPLRSRVVKVAFAKLCWSLATHASLLESPQRNRVTYHAVKIFDTLLDCINRLADPSCAQHEVRANRGRKRTRNPPKSPPPTDGKVNVALRQHFVELLLILNKAECNCEDIWEGAVFCLLSRVGKLLRGFVFEGGEEAATEKSLVVERDSSSRLGNCACQTAPSLIWLLERVIKLCGARTMEAGVGQGSSVFGKSDLRRSSQLLAAALDRIQNALLQVVFPEDPESFKSALATPQHLDFSEDSPLAAVDPGIDPGDVSNWYKQEVWRLVGWEVLRDSITWGP